MKHRKKNELSALRDFWILWSTQSISQLGSSMTTFALTLWLYEKTGSSLSTAALTICSYTPYVLMSIFAGALTDRFDKKRTMLGCDVSAAICTLIVFVLSEGAGKSHLFDNVVCAGNGKFFAGIFQRAGLMVYRSDNRMDSCTGYERKYGRDSQDYDSAGAAGTCLRMPQYASIFYDSDWVDLW